jgi:hypothetical protein
LQNENSELGGILYAYFGNYRPEAAIYFQFTGVNGLVNGIESRTHLFIPSPWYLISTWKKKTTWK